MNISDFSTTQIITSWDFLTLGLTALGQGGSTSATGWQTQNRAIYMPVLVKKPLTIDTFFASNSGASGNFDVGLYLPDGTKIASTGSTGQSANTFQKVTVTAFNITPRLYYLAAAMDNTTGGMTFFGAVGSANVLDALGVKQQSTAFALPSPATFATISDTRIPLVGMISTGLTA